MIKPFLASWALYFLLLFALPFELIYPNVAAALLIQVGFVILVALSFLATSGPSDRLHYLEGEITHARSLTNLALILSIAGLLALIFDKVAIQGIDYSQGLASAREQWRQVGMRRSGFSSPFSVVGYMIGSSYFVAILLVTAQHHQFSRVERMWVYFMAVVLGLANSAITGGRSSLLLLLAFIVSSFVVRRGVRLGSIVPNLIDRVLLAGAAVAVAGYVLLVTSQRAAFSDMATSLYVQQGTIFLGLPLKEWFIRTFDTSALSSILAALVYTGSYLVHSFTTVCAMIDAPPEGGTIILNHPLRLLSRLGLTAPPDETWFLAGRFPSLPGALWYQFGTVGLVLGSMLLGAVSGLATRWSRLRPHALLPAGIEACCCVTLLLSPLIFAGDLLAFPFVVLAVLIFGFLQMLLGWLDRASRMLGGAAAR
jgi:oligosaccharide repeat unit polymerase